MEKVKRIQELRRSNAATAIKNKKKYTRKQKYKNKFEQLCVIPYNYAGRPALGRVAYGVRLITLRHAVFKLIMSDQSAIILL